MTETNRLIVQAPGMSKALLMDLLGGLALKDQRIKVEEEKPDSNLNSDPATVALIGAAGLVVREIIKSVTQIYLERKKAQQAKPETTPEVHVTVHFTMGGKQRAKVTDAAQLDQVLANIPNTYTEISRIQIL